MNKTTINIQVQVFMWTCIFISLGYIEDYIIIIIYNIYNYNILLYIIIILYINIMYIILLLYIIILYWGLELLGHIVTLGLTFWRIEGSFPKWLDTLYFHWQCIKVPTFSLSWNCSLGSFIIALLVCEKGYFTVVFICPCPVANAVESVGCVESGQHCQVVFQTFTRVNLLNLSTVPQSRYCYLRFIVEKTEAQYYKDNK